LPSFKVSYLIAKAKKPHNIFEELLMPTCEQIVASMIGEEHVQTIKKVPSSAATVSRRISMIGSDINEQLVHKLRSRKFAVQTDDSKDAINQMQLLAYCRYWDWDPIKMHEYLHEELLFCRKLMHNKKGNISKKNIL